MYFIFTFCDCSPWIPWLLPFILGWFFGVRMIGNYRSKIQELESAKMKDSNRLTELERDIKLCQSKLESKNESLKKARQRVTEVEAELALTKGSLYEIEEQSISSKPKQSQPTKSIGHKAAAAVATSTAWLTNEDIASKDLTENTTEFTKTEQPIPTELTKTEQPIHAESKGFTNQELESNIPENDRFTETSTISESKNPNNLFIDSKALNSEIEIDSEKIEQRITHEQSFDTYDGLHTDDLTETKSEDGKSETLTTEEGLDNDVSRPDYLSESTSDLSAIQESETNTMGTPSDVEAVDVSPIINDDVVTDQFLNDDIARNEDFNLSGKNEPTDVTENSTDVTNSSVQDASVSDMTSDNESTSLDHTTLKASEKAVISTTAAAVGLSRFTDKKEDSTPSKTVQESQDKETIESVSPLNEKLSLATAKSTKKKYINIDSGFKQPTTGRFKNVNENDLSAIEGIGPKTAELLKKEGINSWSELATKTPFEIKELLATSGSRFSHIDPSSWPRQSKLASGNHWTRLEKLQNDMDGGKILKSTSKAKSSKANSKTIKSKTAKSATERSKGQLGVKTKAKTTSSIAKKGVKTKTKTATSKTKTSKPKPSSKAKVDSVLKKSKSKIAPKKSAKSASKQKKTSRKIKSQLTASDSSAQDQIKGSKKLAKKIGKTKKEQTKSKLKTTTKKTSNKKKASSKKKMSKSKSSKISVGRAIKTSNLQIIEGIGPKMNELLKKEGISSWSKLSTYSPAQLRTKLEKHGDRYRIIDVKSWPKQASYAAKNQWKKLIQYQKKDGSDSKAEKILQKAGVFDRYKKNDLKVIEGIGPKIEELLQNAGIKTWSALSKASKTKLSKILNKAGKRYGLADPSTWPKQANLAAAGKFDKLEALQKKI